MAFLARTLTNKLLHQPSATLRQKGEEGRHDLLDFTRSLFLDSDSRTTKKRK